MKKAFIPINPKFFKHLVKFKGYTFKSLSEQLGVDAHVFSRAIENNRIKKELLDKIGALFNLDVMYITGLFLDNYNRYGETGAEMIYRIYGYREIDNEPYYVFNERTMKKHPYKNRVERTQSTKNLKIALERLFGLMDIPFTAYEELSAQDRIHFLKDFNNSVYPVFKEFFSKKAEKQDCFSSFDAYINNMEEYEEDKKHAEAVLEYYLENPPKEISIEQLKSMTIYELIDLDYNEQIKNEIYKLRQFYVNNPPEGYSAKDVESLSDEQIWDLDAELTNKQYFSKYNL